PAAYQDLGRGHQFVWPQRQGYQSFRRTKLIHDGPRCGLHELNPIQSAPTRPYPMKVRCERHATHSALSDPHTFAQNRLSALTLLRSTDHLPRPAQHRNHRPMIGANIRANTAFCATKNWTM